MKLRPELSRISFQLGIFPVQFIQRRHQGFADKNPAIGPKMAMFVRTAVYTM